ncbi:MAG: hypothetical protein ACR2LJ_06440 [Acidimicrobiales bacterium]
MVLVSFVLVVVAAITLVIGLLQSGLGIIYVSIACSVAAGIVLATAVLRGRPEPRSAGGPSAGRRPAEGAVGAARSDDSTSTAPPPPPPDTWVAPARPAEPLPSPTSAPQPAPEAVPVSASALAAGDVDVAESDDRTQSFDRVEVEQPTFDDGFPIHDYDSLRATEILPMLAELSDDQLDAVEGRERDGKNRAMILKRIASQKQTRAQAWDAEDEGWESEPEPAPAPPSATVPTGPMAAGRAEPAAVGEFPIPDFDDLRALEVLGRLPDLSVSELHLVRRREEDGLRRAMVLNRIDRLVEEAPPEPEPVVVAPRRRATTTRRTSTRSSVGEAPPTAAPPDTPAAEATIQMPAVAEGPAVKRPRTARAATVVPSKKAPATGPVRKAPAATKKAPAATKKATASTRKAVAEAKIISKRTTPAKKTAPRKR